jgi:hypothetical protein
MLGVGVPKLAPSSEVTLILAFVDETSDRDNPRYFGLTLATINANFYRAIKQAFHRELDAGGWDRDIEFKGSYLFSATKGCSTVSVDQRITLASSLLQLNASKKYRRMQFHYAALESDDHRADYLSVLPLLLRKGLPKAGHKGGKDLIKLYCDRREDLKPSEIRAAIDEVVSKRGYTLVEDVVCPNSNRETVGILYADIVGYLKGRIEVIKQDIEVFEGLSPEQIETNGRLRKLRTSTKLVQLISKFETYKVVPLRVR